MIQLSRDCVRSRKAPRLQAGSAEWQQAVAPASRAYRRSGTHTLERPVWARVSCCGADDLLTQLQSQGEPGICIPVQCGRRLHPGSFGAFLHVEFPKRRHHFGLAVYAFGSFNFCEWPPGLDATFIGQCWTAACSGSALTISRDSERPALANLHTSRTLTLIIQRCGPHHAGGRSVFFRAVHRFTNQVA